MISPGIAQDGVTSVPRSTQPGADVGPRSTTPDPRDGATNDQKRFECVSDYTILLLVSTSFGSMRSLTMVLGTPDLTHQIDLKMGAGLARVRFRLYTFAFCFHRISANAVIGYDFGDP